jgi:PhoH-like ATPase
MVTKKKLKTMQEKKTKKMYLLDTNILVYDPRAIFNFEDAFVGIPAIVLEELEQFKQEGTDRGRNTREIIRYLDELRQRGSLGKGVKLDNGSILQVIFLEKETLPKMPFIIKNGDNEILLTALFLKKQGYDVCFISKDLNARVKADAINVESQDYVSEYVSEEEFYHGWIRIKMPAIELKQELPEMLIRLAQDNKFEINEFILAESQHNPHNCRIFRYLGQQQFKRVESPKLHWPLFSRNMQQLMALDLLLDNTIEFVCLFGPAGTGKTFLALLAGLHKVLVEDMYEKILISRPVVPLGRDIGFLPGTLEEKLHSWMLPIYDNMQFIIHAVNTTRHLEEGESHYVSKRKQKRRRGEKRDFDRLMSLEELVRRGKISMEAITYMRGRSIPYQFILIDEAQNLTPHEVKTLISRVGEGSKIILSGDPYQIDSPYLDFSSNGLVITSERFKGHKIFGTVFLTKTERSELSQLATELL